MQHPLTWRDVFKDPDWWAKYIICITVLTIMIFGYISMRYEMTTEKIVSIILTPFLLILAVPKLYFETTLVKTQIEAAQKNQEDIKQSVNQYKSLVLDIDHKLSSVFNLLATGNKSAYPTYLDSIENIMAFKLLGSQSMSTVGSSGSIFNVRLGHYTAEKDQLCKKFLEELLNNKDIIDKNKIYLFIDSGSTVYPIFKLLCDYYWMGYKRDVLKKIEIFTNNIPGFNTLLLYGREGGMITADMIYKCHVIPGTLEGKYSAILGEDSISHLDFMAKAIEGINDIRVSVITGNYISIEDGVLWRGDYHGSMKDVYIKNSECVYIISPLGKIFNMNADEITEMVERSPIRLNSGKSYRKLTDIGNDAKLKPFNDLNIVDSKICRLLPKKLIENKIDKIYIVTSRRDLKTDSIYPVSLLKYFQKIHNKLLLCFGESNIIDIDFSPEIQSEKVVYELSIYKSQLEDIFFNYEFPHVEVKECMKKKIKV